MSRPAHPRSCSRAGARPSSPASRLYFALATLALLAAGCSPGLYRDTYEGTRGALDALQRQSGNAIDPDDVHDLTAAASRGLADGAGLRPNEPMFPALTERAGYGALSGMGRGLRDDVTPAALNLLDGVLAHLHGERPNGGHGPSLAAALLDDASPRLEHISRAQLELLRHELHLTLGDTRDELRLTVRDLSAELRTGLQNDGEQLGLVLRDEVLRNVGEGLSQHVAPGLAAVTESASRGAVRGLRDGLEDLRLDRGRNDTLLWVILALVIGAIVVGTVYGFYLYRQVVRRARAASSVARARSSQLRVRTARRRRSAA